VNIPGRLHVGPIMRHSLILLLLFLSGCVYEVEDEDPMTLLNDRARSTPEQWGQEKVIKSSEWKRGQIISVLTRDTPRHFTPPQTSTIICGVLNRDSDQDQEYLLRWVLRAGVGGARTQVVFDATRFTRIALPIDAFSLGLTIEDTNPAFPDNPDSPVDAFAFVGEGAVGVSDANGPIYSQFFALGANSTGHFVIPEGASAIRVAGVMDASDSPFVTDLTLQVVRGVSILAGLPGRGAAVSDPSLLTLFASGDWIPLVGSATGVDLINGSMASTQTGFIQYKIDL